MKCPHCNKEIEIIDVKEVEHPFFGIGYMVMFFYNFFIYTVLFGLIISALDKYTKIPLSIEDGLSLNFGIMLLLPITLCLLIYVALYRYKKVKGRFLYKA